MKKYTVAKQILNYHFNISPNLALPDGVGWLYPYSDAEVQRVMDLFFTKYFSDHNKRYLLLGINPGRFGAGITGLPFTDPIRMEEECGIPNSFEKRQELSSVFVYEIIAAMGGPDAFYRNYYFTSVCPLGFVKNGKNYNYYDDTELSAKVMPMILKNLRVHLEMGMSDTVAFSMGRGRNYQFLIKLNEEYGFFDKIVPLPHPRWVMQYRLKRKEEFLRAYVKALKTNT